MAQTLYAFKNELEDTLKKYFNKDEIKEVVDYYEEIIHERLDDGELIEHILKDYNPKTIARSMIPKVMIKRDAKERKSPKNMWLILLVLFSSPILIPLGVTYLSMMVVALALVLSGFAVILGGLGGFAANTVRIIALEMPSADTMMSIGLQMIAFSIMLLLGYLMMKLFWLVLEQLAVWFSRLIIRKKARYEDF